MEITLGFSKIACIFVGLFSLSLIVLIVDPTSVDVQGLGGQTIRKSQPFNVHTFWSLVMDQNFLPFHSLGFGSGPLDQGSVFSFGFDESNGSSRLVVVGLFALQHGLSLTLFINLHLKLIKPSTKTH